MKKTINPNVASTTPGRSNGNKDTDNILSEHKYKIQIDLDLETACRLSNRAGQRNLLIRDYVYKLIKKDIR